MSATVVSALILQCFFNRPTDGSVPTDSIPSIRLPVPSQYESSLTAGQPPLSSNSFVGEPSGLREWVFGQPAASGGDLKLLRVTMADEKVLSPSPYTARFGNVSKDETGAYKFTQVLSGWCKLQPASGG